MKLSVIILDVLLDSTENTLSKDNIPCIIQAACSITCLVGLESGVRLTVISFPHMNVPSVLSTTVTGGESLLLGSAAPLKMLVFLLKTQFLTLLAKIV